MACAGDARLLSNPGARLELILQRYDVLVLSLQCLAPGGATRQRQRRQNAAGHRQLARHRHFNDLR
jgi:hypothetical protein